MSKRDWQLDWWSVISYDALDCPKPGTEKEWFEKWLQQRAALQYWLQRVRELEAEVEELCADRNLEKQMRKRQDNRCAELEEQLAVWKTVAQILHQQLLYESRKFYFTVPADLDELAKVIERYLDEVSIEQFEEDLRKAGIEKCPDVEEKDKD